MATAVATASRSCPRHRQRSVPEGHQGVSYEFVQGAFVFSDQGGHWREIAVEHFHHLLRLQFLRYGSKTPDIGKHNGQIFFLTGKNYPPFL
jgi:hypothetical protein